MMSELLPLPSAEEIGRQLGDAIREHEFGNPVENDIFLVMLGQLMVSDASTATDALALVTVARRLLNAHQLPADPAEALSMQSILALLRNAINALELVAKERASTFAGHEWH